VQAKIGIPEDAGVQSRPAWAAGRAAAHWPPGPFARARRYGLRVCGRV